MPFQSHQATADPPAEDNYEAQVIPIVGAILYALGIGIAIGVAGNAVYDGIKWKKKQLKTPKGTVVAITDLVKHPHYLSDVAWSNGDKSDERTIKYPHYAAVDYSYYYINVTKVVWDAEEGEFRSEGSWYWFGSGYRPYSLDHYNNASIGENHELTSSGYHIIFGHTENVNLTHAFDSDVDENSRDDELAALGTNKHYWPEEVYAWLSDMRYRGGGGHFTYKARGDPLKKSKTMSTTVDNYKTLDVVPKQTRLNRTRMYRNKSTLYWKKRGITIGPGKTVRVDNQDGTPAFEYTLPSGESTPLDVLYQGQRIENH